MNPSLRLGVLTPSSNTALEPLTSALVAGLPGASAHFSRFRVTEIALDAQALGQFDDSKILAAAELLADAKVDVIGWSGTAAGWRGFDADVRLCERITERTGIRATTAVLALNQLIERMGITKLALVSPYTGDVQLLATRGIRAIGVDVVAELVESAKRAGGGEFRVASYEDITRGALDVRVDVVASSERWGVEKPSPAFFARVAEAAGVDCAAIAYVGDRLDNDVMPARAAGMFTVFVRRGPWGHLHAHRPEARLADARIDGLDELPAVLTSARDGDVGDA